jgi:hypothetical protein
MKKERKGTKKNGMIQGSLRNIKMAQNGAVVKWVKNGVI